MFRQPVFYKGLAANTRRGPDPVSSLPFVAEYGHGKAVQDMDPDDENKENPYVPPQPKASLSKIPLQLQEQDSSSKNNCPILSEFLKPGILCTLNAQTMYIIIETDR